MENIKKKNEIDLGFIEKCEKWLLANTYFPSKIGGRPAWLDIDNLPAVDSLKCSECNEIVVFLCQVYASLDDSEECFHRTIYVFVCKNQSCWKPNLSKNIITFRSQLPRSNDFYDFEPPSDDIKLNEIVSTKVHLCNLCGCRGPFACSKCKKTFYCSAEHQKIDWKYSHKIECGTEVISNKTEDPSLLFPVFELVLDPEEDEDEDTNETDEQAEARRINEFNNLVQADKVGVMKDVENSDLLPYSNANEDITFGKFKRRIMVNQEQVLRYDRGGEPLWISSENILDAKNVPKCELCQSDRVFEFQIMPQLLNSLKDDHIDWGIINIYTCQKSCNIMGYVAEYAYKQDILNDDK